MRQRSRVWIGALLLLAARAAAAGSEAWAFRFEARAFVTSWHDDLSFHNTTSQDAVATLLGVSDGEPNDGDLLEVPIPAGRTVSLTDLPGVWGTSEFRELWVVHFDVPDGVIVSSRGGLDAECPSPCEAPPNPLPDLGTFTMPVFRSLTPAGVRQFHFGADLGTQPSRSNVGIYNAGDSEATAVVELHRACDDALVGTRVVTVPPNAAVQAGVAESTQPPPCGDPSKRNVWLRYVTVVADQPSLTYVFNVAKDAPAHPHLPFGVAGF